MNVLVTGGTGYIGSHTCVALLEAGHSVIIADNLSNSRVEVVDKIIEITNKKVGFYKCDVTDYEGISKIFKKNKIDGIIHFAGLKAVGESSIIPIDYYYNNIISTIVLMKISQKYGIRKFVFSSSATVYGENKVPLLEEMALLPTTNPYGETKAMCERILTDIANANPYLSIAILRYFNPVGSHQSGLIGDDSIGVPNNLMPYITQVAKNNLDKLKIFGDDYETPDGTGVRDYIHVMDLAEGHVSALEKIPKGTHTYNLGTGKGTSVLELVRAFEEVNNIKIPYEIVERRPGDIALSYADTMKAKRELEWEAKLDIFKMCQDAWNFELKKTY